MLQNNSLRCPSSSVTITSNNPSETQRKHAQLLMKFNEEIFQRNVLTDVECVVEGQIFKTHRALLVCFSPYLKKKLINAEGKPTSKRVHVPKIGSNEFEILLCYMYTGNVEVDCNNFFDVYKAASILEMQDAKSECLQLLDGQDEIRTYFYTYVLSKKLGVHQNWEKALNLITHRFEETVFSKEFMQLNINFVVEMLSAQTIGARSETVVFLAALNWLNYDFGNRNAHAVTVMRCVRFSSMTMEEVVACYHPPFLPGIVLMSDVSMMLYRATCYIAAKAQGQETWFKQFASQKRNLTLESLPMKLWHRRSISLNTEETDLRSGSLPLPLNHDCGATKWNAEPPLFSDLEYATDRIMKTDTESLESNQKPRVQPFTCQPKDLWDLENQSEYNKQSETVCRPRSPGRNGLFYSFQNDKGQEAKEKITNGPREIQYVIPEDTKIIHLIKGIPKFPYAEAEKDDALNVAKINTEQKEFFISEIPEKDTSVSKKKKYVINENPNLIVPRNKISKDTATTVVKDFFVGTHKLDRKALQDIDVSLDTKKAFHSSEKFNSTKEDAMKDGCILVVGGMNPKSFNKESGESVVILNLKTNKWINHINLPEPRHNHCAACLGNFLYVVAREHMNGVVTKRHTPKHRENRPSDLDGLASIASFGSIVVSVASRHIEGNRLPRWLNNFSTEENCHGRCNRSEVSGCNSQETINKNCYVAKRSCFKLDLNTSKWTKLSDMECARFDHAMVVYDAQLFVLGGEDENGRFLKSIEIYKPKHNRWKLLKSNMCCGRKAMGIAVYADRIWIVGGLIQSGGNGQFEAVSHVDCYYPREKKWCFNIYSLPSPRCFCSLAGWESRLYCIGGMVRTGDGKTQATDEVWFVEGENELWKKGPFLPNPRMGGAVVIYGENLYFLGGFNPDNRSSTDIFFLKEGDLTWNVGSSILSHLFGLSAVAYTVNEGAQ